MTVALAVHQYYQEWKHAKAFLQWAMLLLAQLTAPAQASSTARGIAPRRSFAAKPPIQRLAY